VASFLCGGHATTLLSHLLGMADLVLTVELSVLLEHLLIQQALHLQHSTQK
jgi:hypothetical protein